jgi:hypothetical protein
MYRLPTWLRIPEILVGVLVIVNIFGTHEEVVIS